jgi:hypothetical protein
MPYGQQAGYPYAAPKKSRTGLIIGLSVLGVVVLLGIAAVVVGVVMLKDTTVATDMKVGDCIADLPENSRVLTLPTVDCAEPHAAEVYAVMEMPDGDFPGQAAIDAFQNRCPTVLKAYAPDVDDSVGMYVLYPTPETWSAGDRAVTCIATFEDKRSGSLKG